MDPKTAPNLDPKLQEAYNRVMNTTVPQPPAAPQPQTPPPLPITPPQVSTIPTPPSPPPPPPSTPTIPQANPIQPPITDQPQTTVMHATIPLTTTKPSSSAPILAASKSGGKGLSILPFIIIGGIIFLAVYTVFWIKFFKLSIPFLPF